MPPMQSSNEWARVNERLQFLERLVTELSAASGTLNAATIYRGGLSVKGGGSILIEDGGGLFLNDGFLTVANGNIRAIDLETGANLAYFGRLSFSGAPATGLMAETRDGIPYFWATSRNDDPTNRQFNFDGRSARMSADDITLNSASLRLYSLQTTGTAANLTLDVVGGVPIVKLSVSSERYKSDVADVDVDVDDLLSLTGITWVHNDSMDSAEPGPIARNVGWSAERMDEKRSLRQFVNYDDEGKPDSVEDARMSVAILELVKVQQARIDEQAKHIDALTARLDRLEQNTAPLPEGTGVEIEVASD